MLYCVSLSMILSITLILVNFTLSQTYYTSREKPSSFECGFDAAFPSRLPFSMRFFIVTVIFLIFDVEITLILPSPILVSPESSNLLIMMMGSFIVILLGGLAYEWNSGALEWKLYGL